MAIDRVERRMAAIVAADIVGYSRLMEADETGTLAALKAHRGELIDPTIAEYNGRIVKTTGDGMLVEFASVVDAVASSVAIQRGMISRNKAVPEGRRVEFRVGINLGDIIIDGDDIYGDGVNIAARLEQLAEPGGICISGTIYDQLKAQVDVGYADMGEQRVKNIEKPVRAYRVLLDADTAGTFVAAPQPRRRWQSSAVAALIVVVVIAAAGLAWWQPWVARVAPTSVERMAFPLPDKPSIAVLPFDNLSGDPEQDYFAEGMAEDITTDLSKLSGLFVIARNSAFRYEARSVDVKQVGRELGVKYVLEGSVRRAGDQMRINAQLVDAETGGHLWAERYDGKLADVFALQDKVTGRIIEALSLSLRADETAELADHGTTNIEAHDAFLKGQQFARQYTAEGAAQAIGHYKRALELDPDYSRASAALAQMLYTAWRNGWRQVAVAGGYIVLGEMARAARQYAQKAMENPTPAAHIAQARLLQSSRRYDEAIKHAQTAITLDPNDPEGYLGLATLLVFAGEPERAIAHFENARRLDPHNVERIDQGLGLAYFGMSRFAEAARYLERARDAAPRNNENWMYLAATYAHLGRREDAVAAVKQMNALRRERGMSKFRADMLFNWYFKEKTDENRLKEGLIEAGVPEKTF